jgi:hypothetical protein
MYPALLRLSKQTASLFLNPVEANSKAACTMFLGSGGRVLGQVPEEHISSRYFLTS